MENTLKIAILAISVLISLLCLLQEDKNDGVMSLSGNSDLELFKKKKKEDKEKPLKIATAVLATTLFILLTVNMFS